MRTCPRDGAHLRAERWEVRRRIVEVDTCRTCRGLFLDAGEIRALTGNRRPSRALRRPSFVELDSRLKCPGCEEMMETENVGAVRLEICLGCYGLWLDAGELERLQAVTPREVRGGLPPRMLHRDPRSNKSKLIVAQADALGSPLADRAFYSQHPRKFGSRR